MPNHSNFEKGEIYGFFCSNFAYGLLSPHHRLQIFTMVNFCRYIAEIFPVNCQFLPFFQIVILERWIFFLISFQKSWDWFLRWVRYKKRNQFFKKRLPSKISDIRCWWWGCHPADAGAGFWCHPLKMMALKSSRVLQRIQKGWRKRHLQGCKIEEVFDSEKVLFYVMWRA